MMTENTHFGTNYIDKVMKNAKSVFFIGVGGINMSSLAHLTHIKGYRTGGSDRTKGTLTEKLAAEGLDIRYSHAAENIEGYDVVVYTVAITTDNPEYAAATEKGIPCFSRADYMGYLMSDFPRRIGISGMHGKSTCTSISAQIFMDADGDPTVLSGAVLPSMGGAYRIGGRDNFIFEACEYKDSFLDFNPNIAVILNIEPDHLDYFSGIEQILDSFEAYAKKTDILIANADDEKVGEVCRRAAGREIITFAVENDADYRAENITLSSGFPTFDVIERGKFLFRAELSVFGRHNVYNALAAVAAARLCGLDPEGIARGLKNYRGAARRMQYMGRLNGARLFSDYAHHPTELRATLEGLREAAEGRVVAVFQPHTYSRTATLFDEFAHSFGASDEVIITDIYAARETNTYGVSEGALASAIGEKALYIKGFEAVAEHLAKTVTESDTVILLGAGDVEKVLEHLPALDK